MEGNIESRFTPIRADAQVSWQPPWPASERVPPAFCVVTITQPPSLGPHARRPMNCGP